MQISFDQLSIPLEPVKLETLNRLAQVLTEANVAGLVVGAMARDIAFHHRFGITAPRSTDDVDLFVELQTWTDYDAMSGLLCRHGFSVPDAGAHPERHRHENGVELDLVPFGEISEGEQLTWRDGIVWSVAGCLDSLAAADILALPGGSGMPYANPAALVMLKTIAINENAHNRAGKDSRDIGFIISNYLDAGHRPRLLSTGADADILPAVDGDLLLAASRLLGRDLGDIASAGSAARVLSILDREVQSQSRVEIAHRLRSICHGDFGKARRCLAEIAAGIRERQNEVS